MTATTIRKLGRFVNACSAQSEAASPDSGYLRAKLAQEKLIKGSGIPYTILRATQFFEFSGSIIEAGASGDVIRLPSAQYQPIASADVAAALADLALQAPLNGTVELGGPERIAFDVMARRFLAAHGDRRRVVGDAQARYFGTQLDDSSLTAGSQARIGVTRFDDWLARAAAA
ncbi:MAG: SDR family oxidoreductase [Bradyrhizobium sp.]|uniref:SDR family oxidoreductase n=1 Tax=Bradyrhizobium sp. TaxID=376 RepID=UPI001DFF6BF5|nr:SDR family oxidoreductase [Bradyrhizobium sp.]